MMGHSEDMWKDVRNLLQKPYLRIYNHGKLERNIKIVWKYLETDTQKGMITSRLCGGSHESQELCNRRVSSPDNAVHTDLHK